MSNSAEVAADTAAMRVALSEALVAQGHDDVPIGAVVVRDGKVIAARHNERELTGDPTAHAEVLALRDAAAVVGHWRLNDCTLYVTKEPCPMCSGALLMSRVKRVCYAVPDPKMGCLGGATNLNDLPRVNHHVELTAGGVLGRKIEIVSRDDNGTPGNLADDFQPLFTGGDGNSIPSARRVRETLSPCHDAAIGL